MATGSLRKGLFAQVSFCASVFFRKHLPTEFLITILSITSVISSAGQSQNTKSFLIPTPEICVRSNLHFHETNCFQIMLMKFENRFIKIKKL